MDRDKLAAGAFVGTGCLMPIILFILGAIGWFKHVFHCIGTEEWGFLIAGALFFPIAIIHGWGLIFGWFG